MKLTSIPVCYHPTTVVLIDDNRRYVENLSLRLNQETLVPRIFDDPDTALEFLNNKPHPKPFIQRVLRGKEEDAYQHRQIDINIKSISNELYNQERFSEISLVIIDYAMPRRNGLDVCEAIKDPKINKILLTGEADESIATEAFNKGLIQKFIRKDDNENFDEKLNLAIEELQQKYFDQLSKLVVDSLTHHPAYPSSCLILPQFLEKFNNVLEKKQFNEFYLTDTSGSFAFLDFEGNVSSLIVRDKDDMQAAAELAEMSDSEVPTSVLEATKNHTKLLYTGQSNDLSTDPATWESHLYSTEKFSNPSTKLEYYTTFIENDSQSFDRPKIISLRKYLELGEAA